MSGDNTRSSARAIAVAGASGTIGAAVVRALLVEGYRVVALVRSENEALEGAVIRKANLADADGVAAILRGQGVGTVISCIASRSGSPKDAEAVDFDLNRALLEASQAASCDHFILLSAICVQKPKLAFQRAKLRFEERLAAAPIAHTVIRPTAFFKSLSGQVDRVLSGKPFLLFGNGKLTRCKPISDDDLARFIAACARDPEGHSKVLAIGGPGPAISPREQGNLLFKAAGMEPHFRSVPPAMFPLVARVLGLGAGISDWCAEKSEYARIAHYYATQSMLVLDPQTGQYDADATPEFGSDTLIDHYRELIAERSR